MTPSIKVDTQLPTCPIPLGNPTVFFHPKIVISPAPLGPIKRGRNEAIPGFMNPMLLFLLLTSLFLCSEMPLRAADSRVRFDMFLGHDGVVTDFAWFPVTFEVKNDGPGFIGTVELSEASFGNQSPRTFTVELPTGTLKRFTIPFFKSEPYIREWTARLVDEEGRERAEASRTHRHQTPWEGILVGGLSRSAGGMPLMPDFRKQDPNLVPAVARLAPDLFPDNPLTLEGIRMIYLNSERALDLKAPQIQALIAWLHGGGHLVVCLEQVGDLTGLPWLRRLLPEVPAGPPTASNVLPRWLHDFSTQGWSAFPSSLSNRSNPNEPKDVDPADLSLSAPFGDSSIMIYPLTGQGSEVVRKAGGAPWMVTAPRERGQISLLAFNPEREPFVGWQHRGWFWATLCGAPKLLERQDRSFAYRTSDSIFGTIVDSTQIRKLPVGWLLVLLTLYLLVIGPIDRWWLKRIRREMLTWITFPCYVVFFSLLIYWIGYRLRAGDSEWNELQVLDVIPMGENAHCRVRSFGSLYSPVNQPYRFEGQLPFATFRPEARLQGAGTGRRGRVAQKGQAFSASVEVPIWTSELFVEDAYTFTNAPLRVTVSDPLQIVVQNDTGVSISSATLIRNRKIYKVPTLDKGRNVIRLEQMTEGLALDSFLNKIQTQIVEASDLRRSAFGQDQRKDLPPIEDRVTATSFMGNWRDEGGGGPGRFAAPPGLDLSSALAGEKMVFLAWVDRYHAVPSFSGFTPLRNHPMTFFRQVLNPRNSGTPSKP